MSKDLEFKEVHEKVKEHYGKIAKTAPKTGCGCGCGEGDSSTKKNDLKVQDMYTTPEASDLPDSVTDLSLGCGDPISIAALKPGQRVLDLGSGGGIDCFLAAKKVEPNGYVIGVDMTPEMIEKARANQKKMGVKNVEFRLGNIENLPVADRDVDVIISNCVINLSPDKAQTLREAFRVLKPGGTLAVSDIVTDGPLPEEIKNSLSAWAGCIAGALDVKDYVRVIELAGFQDIQITPVFLPKETIDNAIEELSANQVQVPKGEEKYKAIFSARITARKP